MTLYQKVLTAYGLISGSIATKMSEYAVAPEFNPNATYSAGMLVIRENVLYSCVVSHTGAWDPSHFSPSTVDEAIRYAAAKQVEENLGDVDRFAEKTDVAPAFDEDDAYAVGDMVVYENVLYRCTSAHAAGAFDLDHFSPSTVEEVLSSVRSSVNAALALKANLADLPLRSNQVLLEVDDLRQHWSGQLLDRAMNWLTLEWGEEITDLKLTLPPRFNGVSRRFLVYLHATELAPFTISEWPGYEGETIRIMTNMDDGYPAFSHVTGRFLLEFIETEDHLFFVEKKADLAVVTPDQQ